MSYCPLIFCRTVNNHYDLLCTSIRVRNASRFYHHLLSGRRRAKRDVFFLKSFWEINPQRNQNRYFNDISAFQRATIRELFEWAEVTIKGRRRMNKIPRFWLVVHFGKCAARTRGVIEVFSERDWVWQVKSNQILLYWPGLQQGYLELKTLRLTDLW